MSIATLFEKVTGKQEGRKRTLAERWQATVRAIAGGKPPDADAIDELIVAIGRSVEALRDDVSRLVSRQRAASALEAGRDVEARRAVIARKEAQALGACQAACAAAETKFQAALAPLRVELAELAALEKAAAAGLTLLTETWLGGDAAIEAAELRKQLDGLRAQRAQADKLAHNLEREAWGVEDQLKAFRASPAARVYPGTANTVLEDLEGKAAALAAQVKPQQAEAQRFAEAMALLEKRLTEIEQSKLVP